MTWPADLDSSEISYVYTLANTPPYLLKHLRRLAAVQLLANRFNSEEMGKLCAQIASKAARTRTDVARAYALLAAITLRPYSEWRDVINALELTGLDWAGAFIRLMRANAVPITSASTAQTSGGASIIKSTSGDTQVELPTRPQTIILVDK